MLNEAECSRPRPRLRPRPRPEALVRKDTRAQ